MIVQMDYSKHKVSAYIIFFTKVLKYHQKQKCGKEILIKNILVRIYICKVNTGDARTGNSVQSFTKNQTERGQPTTQHQPVLSLNG